jgi:membrane protein
MKLRSSWQFCRRVVVQWVNNEPFELAAALSYYTLFSLTPLLVIAIGIAGIAFGHETAQQQILETIQDLIGPEGTEAVQLMIQNVSSRPETGRISTLLGFVVLFFGAGGVVAELQSALDKIWEVTPKPSSAIWGFLRQRLFSFAMVLAIGFLLLISLIASAILTSLTELLGQFVGATAVIIYVLDIVVSFFFVTLLFAMIYKFVPDARIQWRDVAIGSALTAFLFTIGKFCIGLYLGTSGITSVYGAAGSLITILLWVYYSSLIFFFGAQFTRTYASEYGSGIIPADYAERVAVPSKPGQVTQRN